METNNLNRAEKIRQIKEIRCFFSIREEGICCAKCNKFLTVQKPEFENPSKLEKIIKKHQRENYKCKIKREKN